MKGVRKFFKISPFFFPAFSLVFCKAVQPTRQGSEMAVLGLRRVREENEEPTGQCRPFINLNWQLMRSSELLSIRRVKKTLYAIGNVYTAKGNSQKE